MKILSKNEITQISGGLTFELHYTLDYGVIGGGILGSVMFVFSSVLYVATSDMPIYGIIENSMYATFAGAMVAGSFIGFPRDLYNHFYHASTPKTS